MSTLTDTIAVLEARYSRAETPSEALPALQALAWALRMVDLRRAHALSEEAVRLARLLGRPEDLAPSLCLLGGCAGLLARHGEAKDALDESLALSRSLGDRRTEARCLQFLGRRHCILAEYAAAAEQVTASLEIAEAEWDCIGDSLNLLGVIYYSLCDYAQALHWFKRGLEVREQHGDECGVGASLGNIGAIYSQMDDLAQSVKFYKHGLDCARRLGDLKAETISLSNLSGNYTTLGRLDEARETSGEAIVLGERLGDKDLIGGALVNRGRANAASGCFAAASGDYGRALEIARELQDLESVAEVLCYIGTALTQQGELEQARARLAEAFTLAQSVGARKTAFQAAAGLSEICKRLGDYAAALGHYETFRRLEKEVFSEEADKRTKALTIQMEVEHHRHEAEALAKINAALQHSNLALQEANARLESLATTDPLTSLPNHRALVAALDSALARSQRSRESLALLFLDIDHFKSFNDTYGHPVGDVVLREFADCVRTALRQEDTLGRWGGEEFLALLPGADLAEALQIGERVRAAVARHPLAAGGGLHMTCSIGAASTGKGEDAGRGVLVEAADQALYGAKRLGRNQVRGADDPAIPLLAEPLLPVQGGRTGYARRSAGRSQTASHSPV